VSSDSPAVGSCAAAEVRSPEEIRCARETGLRQQQTAVGNDEQCSRHTCSGRLACVCGHGPNSVSREHENTNLTAHKSRPLLGRGL
jgi:hypothetical protein